MKRLSMAEGCEKCGFDLVNFKHFIDWANLDWDKAESYLSLLANGERRQYPMYTIKCSYVVKIGARREIVERYVAERIDDDLYQVTKYDLRADDQSGTDFGKHSKNDFIHEMDKIGADWEDSEYFFGCYDY